jgi:uncharacterized protein (DUF2141 family)
MKLKYILFVCAVSIMGLSYAQHNLSLTIDGVSSAHGNVNVALYTSQDTFLKFDKVFDKGSAKAIEGKTVVKINDVPAGTYAIAVFHDENGNNELDTNMFGVPKEPVAFSKAKMKLFGPPKFDECQFQVSSDTELIIYLP